MAIGQAYSDVLTPDAQQALESGCDVLIDGCFEDLKTFNDQNDFDNTIFAIHLPQCYVHKYTPLFLKQFTVCIITVA